jgi:release factor glutamine methyltransferase
VSIDPFALSQRLSRAGFVAADEEADELIESAGGDESVLTSLVERRLRGEPLAWIVGHTLFCGLTIHVEPGVYVPRWQSEPLARRAANRLPPRGTALDLCTGSGAIAKYLLSERPNARVVASELNDVAVTCATTNGVEVYHGNLFEPLPRDLEGQVDVIVGVVPYVPTSSLALLPRDTLVFESRLSYDGGEDGVDILRRVIHKSPRYLKPGGALVLELGGDEVDLIWGDLANRGFIDVVVHADDDGDVRGLESTLIIPV